MTRYWIGVASEDHVQVGIAQGFAQLGHGKHAPVQKLNPGDWIAYYSPRTTLKGGDAVQAFTAIGEVKTGDVYQVSQGEGFQPFRRKVEYQRTAKPAPISELLELLSFTRDRGAHWGMAFRRAVFEVPQEDFALIARKMKIRLPRAAQSRPFSAAW